MHITTSKEIVIFVVTCSMLILFLICFITFIVYKYQKKQLDYLKNIQEIQITHDNAMLVSHAEIQEQAFQNISREIHDSIGQKLTLSKLYLNLLDVNLVGKANEIVGDSIKLISEVIINLSDISRGISSELVLNDGLIHAIEYEVGQMEKSGLFELIFDVKGKTFFLDFNTELVLFRIVQESLNNILKHADADNILIELEYGEKFINLSISDNGVGFKMDEIKFKGAGLTNMKKRAMLMDGKFGISSMRGQGTKINVNIPVNAKTLKQPEILDQN